MTGLQLDKQLARMRFKDQVQRKGRRCADLHGVDKECQECSFIQVSLSGLPWQGIISCHSAVKGLSKEHRLHEELPE